MGEQDFCLSFVFASANKWCEQLRMLAELAQTQPQATYTVFSKGFASQWKYHLSSMECHADVFANLDDIINTALFPSLTGHDFTTGQQARTLLSLSAFIGGLTVPVLKDIASEEHPASLQATQPTVDLITPDGDGGRGRNWDRVF